MLANVIGLLSRILRCFLEEKDNVERVATSAYWSLQCVGASGRLLECALAAAQHAGPATAGVAELRLENPQPDIQYSL